MATPVLSVPCALLQPVLPGPRGIAREEEVSVRAVAGRARSQLVQVQVVMVTAW